MRANEWTDWELVKFLAKAFDEGECGIGYDLEFVRGDKVPIMPTTTNEMPNRNILSPRRRKARLSDTRGGNTLNE